MVRFETSTLCTNDYNKSCSNTVCPRRIRTHTKICFTLKNPQFLPNHLTKFGKDWVKIVDFLIKANLGLSPDSPGEFLLGHIV